MDRTARTKATNNVAIQTDSFQDHLGEIGELVQINSFKTIADMAKVDFFQDHLEEY